MRGRRRRLAERTSCQQFVAGALLLQRIQGHEGEVCVPPIRRHSPLVVGEGKSTMMRCGRLTPILDDAMFRRHIEPDSQDVEYLKEDVAAA